MRSAFAANASFRDFGEIEKVLCDGEKMLELYVYLDLYIILIMYGGLKYVRNLEVSANAVMVFDFGRESYAK